MDCDSVFSSVEYDSMASRRRKSRLGGARPGAGRKRVLKDAKVLTVSLDGADYDAIAREADRREISMGTVVREAVKAHLARRRR